MRTPTASVTHQRLSLKYALFGRYTERYQFCAAVKIPGNLVNQLNQLNQNLEAVLSRDTDAKMQESFNGNAKFYYGDSVVAAKPYGDHAEYRVLKHIMDEWKDERTDNFLLIYTYLSPCSDRCANKDSKKHILDFIDFMTSWGKEYALVFQKPYSEPRADSENRRSIPEDELKKALTAIADVIGDQYIFRCYKPESGPFHCIRCFSETNNIVDECYETNQETPSAKRARPPDSGSQTDSDVKKRKS